MAITTQRRFALLIGIDTYLRPKHATVPEFRDLRGCCPDIHGLHDFLLQKLGLPPEHIRVLLSPQGETPDPTTLPTYDAIIRGIRWLKTQAKPGDQVIIAYSGHGGRALTDYPSLKGRGATDEGLIPVDYLLTKTLLRDVELAAELLALTTPQTIGTSAADRERPVEVILLFDSCHSGGSTRAVATRTEYQAVRMVELRAASLAELSPTSPLPALKPSLEAVSAAYRVLEASAVLPKGALAPWPVLPNTLQLAACCGAELANEQMLPDTQLPRGIFSYFLQEALPEALGRWSWKQLGERVKAKVASKFSGQNPLLIGAPGLEAQVVFGEGVVLEAFPLHILSAETHPRTGNTDVRFAGGPGLDVGAKLGLYSLPGTDPSGVSAVPVRIGTAVVRQSELGRVVARALDLAPGITLRPGMPAVLESAGPSAIRSVWLELNPSGVTQAEAQSFRTLSEELDHELTELRRLSASGGAFLQRAENRRSADYCMEISIELGQELPTLILKDGRDNRLPNVNERFLLEDADAMHRAVRALNHIARYQSLLLWQSPTPGLPKNEWLDIRCLALPSTYTRTEKLPPLNVGRELEPLMDDILLSSGEYLTFRFVNKQERSEQRIYLYCFCFCNDYSIVHWPIKQQAKSDPAIPGAYGLVWLEEVRFKAEPKLDHDVSHLKIFASTVNPNLESLRQDALSAELKRGLAATPRGLDFGQGIEPFSSYVGRIALRMKD